MIDLNDLLGVFVSLGKIILVKGVIFEIDYFMLGMWNLIVLLGVGKYFYVIKIFSKINVDFDFVFVIFWKRMSFLLIFYFFNGE